MTPPSSPSRQAGRSRRAGSGQRSQPAETLPVARVVVDTPLPHLDRLFDYTVPAKLDEQAVAGCRVRVRFAGQLADGFLLERAEASNHDGKLAPLERVVSPEPVLSPEIAGLARAVADRYAGTLADVLRLAIPPRRARTEAEPAAAAPAAPTRPDQGPWHAYPAGPSFLAALAEGRAPRAVWSALPGPDWPQAIAAAVRATLAGGRGVVVVVPDARDLARVGSALASVLGGEHYVALAADLGPAERYRRWLALRRGNVRAVVGTRAAMFAPVADLGLAVIWDDGDDLHAEPHAPYPHVRDVLALRAHRAGAGVLIGGFARTAEATRLVATDWARPLTADRATVRCHAPRVRPGGDDSELARDEAARSARLPSLALRAAREALHHGPVLVQVPRRGYLPALACARCHRTARCPACAGPLALRSSHAAPLCLWCGVVAGTWRCTECTATRVRAVAVGARRTAEELGRAFPAVTVRTSGKDGVLDTVGPSPALMVATPGAEPVAEGGYAAALLLDGGVLLGRAELRASEEALRRWMNAAALVRPAPEGGVAVVLADAGLAPVQSLVRWDPATHAERELTERTHLGFPPAVRMASLTGDHESVRALLATAELPEGAEVLGPVEAAGGRAERALVRVPRSQGVTLARALRAAQGVRSARKATGVVRVQLDPLELV